MKPGESLTPNPHEVEGPDEELNARDTADEQATPDSSRVTHHVETRGWVEVATTYLPGDDGSAIPGDPLKLTPLPDGTIEIELGSFARRLAEVDLRHALELLADTEHPAHTVRPAQE